MPAAILIENRGVFSRGKKTLLAAPRPALAGALEGYGFELMGLGAAVENMWLAATSVGLSAAFLGDIVIAETEIQRLLGFNGDLVGGLALGYSDVRPPMPTRVDDDALVVWHRSATLDAAESA